MASLTIGGQIRAIRPSAEDLGEAEKRIMKEGGRPLLAAFAGRDPGFLGKGECEWIVWSAWRHALTDAQVRTTLAEFYQAGGTLFELHQEVLDAILDSGLVGRRTPPTNGAGPPGDPPTAGAPGS